MPDNDTLPCAQCGAPLARDCFGLDTYDEGYSILPEGKFRVGDGVCLDCYERNYSTCEVCEVEIEAESAEAVEAEGDTLHTCEACARSLSARVLRFVSRSGISWSEDFVNEVDAAEAWLAFFRENQGKGREVIEHKDGRSEVLEPDDAVMVPDWAGVFWVEPAPLPKYWTRSMRRAAGR